jgi:hypothetical protein
MLAFGTLALLVALAIGMPGIPTCGFSSPRPGELPTIPSLKPQRPPWSAGYSTYLRLKNEAFLIPNKTDGPRGHNCAQPQDLRAQSPCYLDPSRHLLGPT